MPKSLNLSESSLTSADFLIACLHRVVRENVERPLTDAGFSLRTHWILSCLSHQPLSQQQVCNALAIDRSDMVRIVDELEQRGLLTRARDKKDRRKHTLTLTESGQAAYEQSGAIVESAIDSVFRALTKKEKQTFHRLALKVLAPEDASSDDAAQAEAKR
ncbi:MarR family winged helix-turn-helix transcriptional regulator [Hoyosella subflava]|uniref:Putative MarR family transcriptional regulator n=1 Tax=Hoyosella subflava (strain DSM 45089 / JCM 17490 / NBRC 109087 / DQS3-9A1) TaxID=443218 RepID=F6EG61_HOYSD|nr:MarR family transcriptional regulator [Hoyosella subflava]AEF38763.1 Putative MarR family transcriptional regulator [Hoyosella subflava DQS3-9A1]